MKHTKTMRKILVPVLSLLLCLCFLVSCNNSPSNPDDTTVGGSSDTSAPDSATTADGSGEGNSDETVASDPTPGETSSGETPAPSDGFELEDPDALTLIKGGESRYEVIFSENFSNTLTAPASEFGKTIQEKTGVRLTVHDDFEHQKIEGSAATDYEILIGTVRKNKYFDYTAPEMTLFDYHITVVGTRVLILGGSSDAIIAALNYFTDNYVPKESTDTWKVPKDLNYTYILDRSNSLKFMSQNLLNNDTEYVKRGSVNYLTGLSVDQPGKNAMSKRQPRIRDLILTEMPDVLGLQECSGWHAFLKTNNQLRNAGYTLISSDKDAKLSILYNKNTVTLLSSGSIWLSEDPENLRCSEIWGSDGNPRLAFFGLFKQNSTGKEFIFVDTHIGFENTVILKNHCRVAAEYCSSLYSSYGNLPVVCVGDFNTKTNTEYYQQYLTSAPHMGDTKFTALESSVGWGSMSGLGCLNYKTEKYPIDQIFASKNEFHVLTYKVDYTCFGDGTYETGEFASDHFAIVATMVIKDTE